MSETTETTELEDVKEVLAALDWEQAGHLFPEIVTRDLSTTAGRVKFIVDLCDLMRDHLKSLLARYRKVKAELAELKRAA